MPVTDIIGSNPSGAQETTTDSTGVVRVTTTEDYRGADPSRTQFLFAMWSWLQVFVGAYVIMKKWNSDLVDGSSNTYEKFWRTIGISLTAPYLPAALFWLPMQFVKGQVIEASFVNIYYILSVVTYGGPFFTWFFAEVFYLKAGLDGFSSGLYIKNTVTYWLNIAHLFTFQAISLMVQAVAIPAIKAYLDIKVNGDLIIDETKQDKPAPPPAGCDKNVEYSCNDKQPIQSLIRTYNQPALL